MLSNRDCGREATLCMSSTHSTVIGYHQLAASNARTAKANVDHRTRATYQGEEARSLFNAVNAFNFIGKRGLTAAEILQVATCIAERVAS